ncbi:hypothetical protein GCM10023340_32330 [Nocardioides marinquilinus]|uniref:Uncharacterized protein n=1 Tax=Nocardioides marinquilinus TaxID=1210400 RepID=A0ABP9PU72_9ACTN
MNLPEQPPTFRRPAATDRPWWWRCERADGEPVDLATVPDHAALADQRFATQADAESWVGETWPDLAAAGVDQVTLLEHDRPVYGPMSLHA